MTDMQDDFMHDDTHDDSPAHRTLPTRAVRRSARGLGWFSLGLGLAEVLMPQAMARATGMRPDRTAQVRACGVREIVTGLGLLMARNPAPWLWARLGGDAIDLVALGSEAGRDSPRAATARLAMAAVAGVAAVDGAAAVCAQRSAARDRAARDYSDRRGMPLPPNEMRGAALGDYEAPSDTQMQLQLH